MFPNTQQDMQAGRGLDSMRARTQAPPQGTPNVTPADCLAHCQDQIAALLVGRLALQPVALPSDLACAAGMLRGQAVRMYTQRFSGSGFLSLTVARIETSPGRLCSLTVVGIPQPGAGLPILGMDLIGLSGSLSLVAVDLAPTDAQGDASTWHSDCAPLLRDLQRGTADALIPRKRPQFTVDTFSALSVIAGARNGTEEIVLRGLTTFVQQASDLWLRKQADCRAHGAETESPRSQAELDRIRRWMLAEQSNRKEHNALSAIFGADFAARYLHGFLFDPPARISVPEGI